MLFYTFSSSLFFPLKQLLLNTIYPLTMSHQPLCKECMAPFTIRGIHKALTKALSLYMTSFGKPTRFIEQIFSFALPDKLDTLLCQLQQSSIFDKYELTKQSVFLVRVCSQSAFVSLNALEKRFVIKQWPQGPSCQWSSHGFNYRKGRRWKQEPVDSRASISKCRIT